MRSLGIAKAIWCSGVHHAFSAVPPFGRPENGVTGCEVMGVPVGSAEAPIGDGGITPDDGCWVVVT
jgi:hypothetical protein